MVKIYRRHYAVIWKCMRITSLCLFLQAFFTAVLLAGSLHAQSVSLNVEKASIKAVFATIESQAKVTFAYNEETLKQTPLVNLKFTGSLLEVLKRIGNQTALSFKQSGSIVAVARTTTNSNNTSQTEQMPNEVGGRVTDKNGKPIPGVTVSIRQTATSTISDKDGIYHITAIPGQTINFSYVGFSKKDIVVTELTVVDVTLDEDVSTLDEVHIIAYGTTTRRLSTSSISKVDAKDIGTQPVNSLLATLQGRVPGLFVTQSSGLYGSGFNVQIEGRTSIENTSTPLYIIDGVPLSSDNLGLIFLNVNANQSPLNSINPQDIESIEVLRDADATAIYGSRGANGVILITTKKGNIGKAKIDINVYSGAGKASRFLSLLNTTQYLEMRREAFKNDGVTPSAINAPDLFVWDQNKYTDWQKLLIGGTSHVTDIQSTVSGGIPEFQYLIGGNYHHESTVFPVDNGANRAGVHINLNARPKGSKFKIDFSASYSNESNNLVPDLTTFINTPPNAPGPLDADGKLVWSPEATNYINPLAATLQPYNGKTGNLISNSVLQYGVLKNLNLKVSLGYNSTTLNQYFLQPKSTLNPALSSTSSANFTNNYSSSWIIEPQLQYTRQLKSHKLDFLLGTSWQKDIVNGSTINASNFSSDALIKSPAAAGTLTAMTNYADYRYQSIFARLNYNFDDRYIVNLTGRRDGSSRFGPGRRFGNFGAIGAAWIVSEEKWLKSQSVVSFMKLRASYGVTGNDKIGDYQFLDTYGSTGSPYQGTAGLIPSNLSNPTYSWETNTKISAGLDMGFAKDRFLVTANYFRNRSGNQLVRYTLPSQTGFSGILENFPALVQNSGFEFSLSSKTITKGKFNWTTSFNLTIPRNKLIDFPGLETSTYSNRYLIGYPLDIRRTIDYNGVDSQTGVYTFVNTNLVSGRTATVDITPKFYGGLQNSVTLGNLQVDFFFQFVKRTGPNYFFSAGNPPGSMYNVPVSSLDRWQKAGDLSGSERFTTGTSGTAGVAYTNFSRNSNGAYSDASFVKLKNVSLSYTLPKMWRDKIRTDNARIFIQGQNLLTITNYKGGDPEVLSAFTLPTLRMITAGFQITY
jgi:TonB-linked SusC/RagA family outer membrane protein